VQGGGGYFQEDGGGVKNKNKCKDRRSMKGRKFLVYTLKRISPEKKHGRELGKKRAETGGGRKSPLK